MAPQLITPTYVAYHSFQEGYLAYHHIDDWKTVYQLIDIFQRGNKILFKFKSKTQVTFTKPFSPLFVQYLAQCGSTPFSVGHLVMINPLIDYGDNTLWVNRGIPELWAEQEWVYEASYFNELIGMVQRHWL